MDSHDGSTDRIACYAQRHIPKKFLGYIYSSLFTINYFHLFLTRTVTAI